MLGNVFNIFSIVYAFRGLQVAANVIREWAVLRGPDFTSNAKGLAQQSSFFLAVPIGVFFHELSHALAIWLFGGRVVEFAYRVFWGYVVPDRFFRPEQEWFISLAGTLGSLVFGLVVWLILRTSASPTFRYFGLQAFRYQVYFSLIYYPIFTALIVIGSNSIGDWLTIYNFNATPILSGATAVLHAATLFWFWRADRNGFFEIGAFGSVEELEKIKALEASLAANPYDGDLHLKLIDAYRRAGMSHEATKQAQQFLKENPNSADANLQLAILEVGGKERVPEKASNKAQKALDLGLSKPEAIAAAHQIVGKYEWGRKRIEASIDHYSQAIRAIQESDKKQLLVSLLYNRGLAYRRREQYEPAYQDIQKAIGLAESEKMDNALPILKRELETISRQS
jgi:hypothetical protein